MSSEPTSESADRLEAAEAFLQEAVYRSRAKQAASFGLAREARAAEGADTVQCGLGREAAIELDLAEKGRALADRIWSAPSARCRSWGLWRPRPYVLRRLICVPWETRI